MRVFQKVVSLLSAINFLLATPSLAGAANNQSKGDVINAFKWEKIKYVYAFGDSYSFVQGTLGYPNFSFIGYLQDLAFSPQQILTNEIIARNTSSEGSNWLEYLTGCFSGSPTECAVQLWDFAFAGSDIDAALLPLHHPYTVSLVEQVNQWSNYASKVLPHPPHETLTTWWIGINDTGDTISNTTITNFTAFWETEMTSYFNAVEIAHTNGLKNHLFINVPPEDRAPGTISSPAKATLMKTHIELFNTVLAEHIARFAADHKGAAVLTFDANAWFNAVLNNASDFGFTNITGFCTCADPTGFFWYNTGHPTQRVHQLLAKAISAQLLDV